MLSNRGYSVRVCFASLAILFAMATGCFAAPTSGDVKVAVLPFEIFAGDDLAYLKDSLPELLSDKLKEAGFDVIPQAEVKKVLLENGIDKPTDKSAQKAALLLGAGFSVYGALNQIGDTVSIDGRVVDAFSDDEPKKVSASKDGLINLLAAVDDLVAGMRSGLLRQDIIAEIDVKGVKVLDKEVVLMRLPLSKGDFVTAKSMNEALKSIYNLGYFDDVKVLVSDTSAGKRVVFDVVEKPRIQAIGVVGADAIDSEDIIEAVSTKKGGVINPKILAEDIKVVREMYRKEGYYRAKVTHELETGDNGQARLNFVIDEGNKLYITDITIDGAKQLDEDDIKDELVLQERGLFSFFTSTGILNEDYMERDAAAILAYYHNNGFIDAKVSRAELDIQEEGIHITFRVIEGDRYKMGDVSFTGDLIEEPSQLKSIIKVDDLKEDEEYYNRSTAQDDVKKLTSYYNNKGFAYTDVSMKMNDDREAKVVNLVFNIAKHQKVHIRRVLLEGNTITRDNVVLRYMTIADGDTFSGQKLNSSTRRLDSLGYFDSVNISPVQTGNPDEMDLLVKVKEKPTGTIGGGVGYSTYDGPFVGVSLGQRNLFGKGYLLNLGAQLGGKTTAFTIDFMNPRINDSKLGMALGAHSKSSDYNDYSKDSTGGDATLLYPLGTYTTARVKYALDYYELYDIDDDADDDVKDDEGAHVLSEAIFSLNRNTLDSNKRPTAGYSIGASFANGGGVLGGTDNFIKYTLSGNYYHKVIGNTVFHYKGYVGLLHENFNDDEVPSDQRFKLGGSETVRGYSSSSIVCMEDDDDDKIGGTKAFYSQLELIVPVSEEFGLDFVPFFDLGNVWDSGEFWFDSVDRFGKDGPDLGLYKGVGAEVRWNSPMGPLRVSYGYGLDDLEDSKQHVIDFSVGKMF